MPLRCDVVVFAHNEAGSIEQVVRSVLTQSWSSSVRLGSAIVCSTASTDGTDELVRRLAAEDSRIELLASPVRRGKARDVNLAVGRTSAPLLVLMDADISLNPDCLPLLVAALADPSCGMAVPLRAIQAARGLLQRVGRFAAELQNVGPAKAGQVLAIRRELASLPPDVTLDDAYQEHAVHRAGLTIRRVDGAVVTSTPPATLVDYLRQRRRVVAQCLGLQRATGYRPATRSAVAVMGRIRMTPTGRSRTAAYVVPAAAVLDVAARLCGRWDYHVRNNEYPTWSASPSAKPYA